MTAQLTAIAAAAHRSDLLASAARSRRAAGAPRPAPESRMRPRRIHLRRRPLVTGPRVR
jgi:hypothetical protein